MSVKLDLSDRERLASLAATRNRTSHFLMKQAVQDFLAREEARQAFIADAKASWEHYTQTGLHVTLGELRQWSDTLTANPDAPMPVCHN
ncbi:CopG family ribbon-helix-helix protein [Candidatus Thiothrix anitrata]|uniref:CopG family transcriptional regulator n=1 Tax=Candidatus Thiothrix anitrata TaxID=2823902 RepID=A0ABX7X2U9_9GAMM|nr:ribbon-helix-helix domain-containing protein [Candidatus Thiothrix anitrata]QTR48933.1 CopG family transcriptional regulator [Candidatus Thiothrix anitrata]